MTTVEITYDCPNECTYTMPTTLVDGQTGLRNAPLVDTLAMMADAQHDRECPTPSDGN